MREITIMRQLSKMNSCLYSPKLYNIIIPEKYHDNILECPYLFIVMEYFALDFNLYLKEFSPDEIDPDKLKIIIYNLICG